MNLNPEIEKHLSLTINNAIKNKYEIVTIEQFILELINEDRSKTLLKTCGVDIKRYEKNLEEIIEQHTPSVDNATTEPPQISLALQRLLQRSWAQAVNSGKTEVMPSDIFVSLYFEEDCHAKYFLETEEKVSKLKLMEVISHSSISNELKGQANSNVIGPEDNYLLNLNRYIEKNNIESVNRNEDLDRLYLILSRKTKNNPLIVGEPGVGKTTFIYSFVESILAKTCPEQLKDSEVFLLDSSLLQAGAKFKGEFEERFLGVIQQLENHQKKCILVIDDIHHIMNQSQQNSGGGNDITGLLKPVFLRGNLSVIATTNQKDIKYTFDKNKSLDRYFQKMELLEPDSHMTKEILHKVADSIASHHDLQISSSNLDQIIQLSERYLFDRCFPDKAIDLLDEACALHKMTSKKEKLSKKSIDKALAKMASMPGQTFDKSEEEALKHLEQNLKLSIYGQDHAIEKVSKAIKSAMAGLQRPNKPIGAFLFSGPTGVGKTDLARQIAMQLHLKFQKFDMSEYMEKHAVSRLVGAPPGYVGYEEGGLLTEAIHKSPYSLILLDEIEKAHPDIMNILLQIMDDASITDTNGKKVNCRNIILIMTTNAGAVDMTKAGLGIIREEVKSFNMDMIKKAFRPEFINRIDAVIPFQHLNKTLLERVIEKFLSELQVLLQNKKIHLNYDKKLIDHLLDKGYDPAYGARPFHRIIDEKIKAPLIDEILFGKLKKGGEVTATANHDKVEFKIK